MVSVKWHLSNYARSGVRWRPPVSTPSESSTQAPEATPLTPAQPVVELSRRGAVLEPGHFCLMQDSLTRIFFYGFA